MTRFVHVWDEYYVGHTVQHVKGAGVPIKVAAPAKDILLW